MRWDQTNVCLSWLSGHSTQALVPLKPHCPCNAPHSNYRVREVRGDILASFLWDLFIDLLFMTFFSPVPFHLMVMPISTISSGNKFPKFSICHVRFFLLLSVINSFVFHWVPTLQLLMDKVNNRLLFPLLSPSCFVSLSKPSSASPNRGDPAFSVSLHMKQFASFSSSF